MRNECDLKTQKQSVDVQIDSAAPAFFVYIQLNHPNIDAYELSKNGFIHLIPNDNFTISFMNKQCAIELNNNHINIMSVNDFIAVDT